MLGYRVVMCAAAVALLSGCATSRSRQDLARLQSQVGLLNERVTQLERSTMAGGATGGFGEYATDAVPVTSAIQPVGKPAAGTAAAPKVTTKPSTRQIQQALKNAGFYQGAVDGKMGPQTRDAIREFQRLHGLVDDGVAGKKTWAKLSAYSEASAGVGEVNAAEVLK